MVMTNKVEPFLSLVLTFKRAVKKQTVTEVEHLGKKIWIQLVIL